MQTERTTTTQGAVLRRPNQKYSPRCPLIRTRRSTVVVLCRPVRTTGIPSRVHRVTIPISLGPRQSMQGCMGTSCLDVVLLHTFPPYVVILVVFLPSPPGRMDGPRFFVVVICRLCMHAFD